MQCVILAGGKGTRLGELTRACPKPLLPVNGAPFLAYLINKARMLCFTDILLLTGYLRETFYPFVNAYAQKNGVKIQISEETEPLGTGGALKRAINLLDDEFLLINGDTYFDFDWRAVKNIAVDPAILRMALFHPETGSRYGKVKLRDGQVEWNGTGNSDTDSFSNGGVYWLSKSLLAAFPSKTPLSLENEIFPLLASQGQIRGQLFDSYFIDIGVPEDYARAQSYFANLE